MKRMTKCIFKINISRYISIGVRWRVQSFVLDTQVQLVVATYCTAQVRPEKADRQGILCWAQGKY
jgi:hypothetical protein